MKRFELALHTFLAKNAQWKAEHPEQGSSVSESGIDTHSDSHNVKGKSIADSCTNKMLETDLGRLDLKSDSKDTSSHNLLVKLGDCVTDFNSGDSDSNQKAQQMSYTGSSINSLLSETDSDRTSCSYIEMPLGSGATGLGARGVAIEGPSEEGSCYHLENNSWLVKDQSRHCFPSNSSCNGLTSSDWGRYGTPLFSWGGRVVGGRRLKAHSKGKYGVHEDEHEAFVNIFEGGSVLYCNMSFEALLNVRKQLEELGFPCKAVNDGLWLQV